MLHARKVIKTEGSSWSYRKHATNSQS